MLDKRLQTAEREERRYMNVAKAARTELEEAMRLRDDAQGVQSRLWILPCLSQPWHSLQFQLLASEAAHA